jgi:hypothetical protein
LPYVGFWSYRTFAGHAESLTEGQGVDLVFDATYSEESFVATSPMREPALLFHGSKPSSKFELEPTTNIICHTIGCHLAADGSGCVPSCATIAKDSGLHRATVVRHVEKPAAAGFLEAADRHARERSSGWGRMSVVGLTICRSYF